MGAVLGFGPRVVLLLMDGIFVETEVGKAGEDFTSGELLGKSVGCDDRTGCWFGIELDETECCMPVTFAEFHFKVGDIAGPGVWGVWPGGKLSSARDPMDLDLLKLGIGGLDLSSGLIPRI